MARGTWPCRVLLERRIAPLLLPFIALLATPGLASRIAAPAAVATADVVAATGGTGGGRVRVRRPRRRRRRGREGRRDSAAARLRPAAAAVTLGAVAAQHEYYGYDAGLFRTMDTNGDGVIDRSEYMLNTKDKLHDGGYGEKEVKTRIYEYTADLYDLADMDRDGFLSKSELNFAQYLGSLDHAHDDPPDFGGATAEFLVEVSDTNKDGSIDPEEFKHICLTALANLQWHWVREETAVLLSTRGADPLRAAAPVDEVIFRQADADGDRKLSMREMQYASFLIGDIAMEDLLDAVLRDADRNADGKLGKFEACNRSSLHHHPGGVIQSFESAACADFTGYDLDGDMVWDENEMTDFARRYFEIMLT